MYTKKILVVVSLALLAIITISGGDRPATQAQAGTRPGERENPVITFIPGENCDLYLGDFDRDSRVNKDDLKHLEASASGPAILQPDPSYQDADFDDDGDVDQDDFGAWQLCYSGDSASPAPECSQR